MIPMFFDVREADTWRNKFSPGSVVRTVSVDGCPAFIVETKRQNQLVTIRVLLVQGVGIDRIIDEIHGNFTADCRVDSVELVDVGDDYPWDCSFFEDEKS